MVDGMSCSGVLPKGKANAADCLFRLFVPENRRLQNVTLIENLFCSKAERTEKQTSLKALAGFRVEISQPRLQ